MPHLLNTATVERLDRATAYQLIDHVAVHEQANENGLDVQTIQIMRHANPETTRRYIHKEFDIAPMLEIMNKFFKAPK